MPDVLDQLRRIPSAPLTPPEPLDRLRERVAASGRRRHRLATGSLLLVLAVVGTIVILGRDRDAPTQVTTDPGRQPLWTRADVLPEPISPQEAGPVAAGDSILVEGGFTTGEVIAYDAHSGDERWRYSTGDTTFVQAATNELAIVSPQRGYIAAVAVATGDELWRFPVTPDESPEAATIAGDTVFFGTSVTYEGAVDPPAVYAVDLGGKQRWRTTLDPGTDLEWAPPTVQDGLVLVADTPSHPGSAPTSSLHALDAGTGAVRWRADLRNDQQGFHHERPVLVDGVVHAVSTAGEVLSFDATDGRLLWFDALGATLPRVAGATDGLVYVAFSDGVRAFDQRTGRREWELGVETASILVDGDTLYAAGGASLHAIDTATGTERWRHPQPVGRLALVDSALIHASVGQISAIDATTGRVTWSASRSGIVTDPLVVDGVVVVGTSDGDLVAFTLDGVSRNRPVRVPDVEGLPLEEALRTLSDAALRGAANDGDPTDPGTVVVAQEPPSAQSVPRGTTVGLRTALVSPSLCAALEKLPDFADGTDWNLPVDVLKEVAGIAAPALRQDAQLIIEQITGADLTPDRAESRALDRLVVHRRACP